MKKKLVVAICGASGTLYGIRLLSELLKQPVTVHLIISKAGRTVLQHENGYAGESFSAFLHRQGASFHEKALLKTFDSDNFFSPPASGSFRHDGMVIAPCSMRTLANIAAGIADNLIHRAADVCLKEKRPLILLPREMPLNAIHLKNMYRLAMAGGTILPPCPSFYSHPETLDDLVNTVIARVLDQLQIDQTLIPQWGG